MARSYDLTSGSIPQHLLRLAAPLIMGNILQQLYNTVDAFILGRFAGDLEFAAVGVAGSVMNLFLFMITGACTGISVIFAQLYGAGERERFRREQALRAVRMSRAAYYPQITLTGGYDTNVYHSFATGAVNPAFGRQFRNNSTEYVGVAINIPIFNRMATRNSVRTAKLGVRSQQLVLTEAEQTLQKEIETAYYQADAALLKYRSAEKALNSAQVAFRYEAEKYAAGRSTTFDYNDAKTRMQKAESDQIQAKYEFIFRTKILDFYAGFPLTL